MALPSPVVAGWELVLRLRERREQVGVEVKQVTQTLGFSRNYWSAVENERKILSEEALKKLLELRLWSLALSGKARLAIKPRMMSAMRSLEAFGAAMINARPRARPGGLPAHG